MQDSGSGVGVGRGLAGKRPLCGSNGGIDVLGAGNSRRADEFAGRRIVDREAPAAPGRLPTPVDEEVALTRSCSIRIEVARISVPIFSRARKSELRRDGRRSHERMISRRQSAS